MTFIPILNRLSSVVTRPTGLIGPFNTSCRKSIYLLTSNTFITKYNLMNKSVLIQLDKSRLHLANQYGLNISELEMLRQTPSHSDQNETPKGHFTYEILTVLKKDDQENADEFHLLIFTSSEQLNDGVDALWLVETAILPHLEEKRSRKKQKY